MRKGRTFQVHMKGEEDECLQSFRLLQVRTMIHCLINSTIHYFHRNKLTKADDRMSIKKST